VSYKTDEILTHCLHKTVSVWFIDINIISDVEVDTANAASLVTQWLLYLTILKYFTRILPQNATTLRLYYIKFAVAFDKLVLSIYTLLGKYFFVNKDFGPFTLQIYKAQDMLLNSLAVIVHFFTLGTEWLNSYIVSLNTSL